VNSGEATHKSSSMLTLSKGKCNAKMERSGTNVQAKKMFQRKNLMHFVNLAWLDMLPLSHKMTANDLNSQTLKKLTNKIKHQW